MGRFDVTVLGFTVGNPELQFLVSEDWDSGSASFSAIQAGFRAGGSFTGTSAPSGMTIAIGVPHRFEFYVDLSSGTQDTWGCRITRLDTTNVLHSIRGLNTRAPNCRPNRVVWNASVNPGAINPDPFARVTNIHIEARNKVRPTLFFMK